MSNNNNWNDKKGNVQDPKHQGQKEKHGSSQGNQGQQGNVSHQDQQKKQGQDQSKQYDKQGNGNKNDWQNK